MMFLYKKVLILCGCFTSISANVVEIHHKNCSLVRIKFNPERTTHLSVSYSTSQVEAIKLNKAELKLKVDNSTYI